jgi:hypothetical protein
MASQEKPDRQFEKKTFRKDKKKNVNVVKSIPGELDFCEGSVLNPHPLRENCMKQIAKTRKRKN